MTSEGNRKMERCFAFPTGNTLDSHKEIMKQLTMQGLSEVMSAQECDVILVFCPVVSHVGTDIEEAFTHVPKVSTGKPVILVVMHHTFKQDYTAYDSSRYVSRKDVILTVDCLFHDCNGELPKCDQNDAAVKEIVQKLAPTANAFDQSDGQNSANNDHQRKERKDAESKPTEADSILTRMNEFLQKKGKKFYTKVTGNTLGSHENIKSQLMKQHFVEVDSPDECDIILAFCPIISRAGSDIEAACRMIPEGKPVVLVVLHHTFNSDYTVPDVKKHVTIPKVKLLVDFLFHESMGGLLKCNANDAAFKKIKKLAPTANAFNQSDGQSGANNDHQREEKKDAESKQTEETSTLTRTDERLQKIGSLLEKACKSNFFLTGSDYKQQLADCKREVEALAKDLQGQNNWNENQLQGKACKMEDTSQRLKYLDEERKIDYQLKESDKFLHAQNSEIENLRQQLRESDQKVKVLQNELLEEKHKKTQYEDWQVVNVTMDTELEQHLTDLKKEFMKSEASAKETAQQLTDLRSKTDRLICAYLTHDHVVEKERQLGKASGNVQKRHLEAQKEDRQNKNNKRESPMVQLQERESELEKGDLRENDQKLKEGNKLDALKAFIPIVPLWEENLIKEACAKIPEGKPVILVVLHKTFDPDDIRPDSSSHVTRSDVILTVNFLFHMTTGKLLKCSHNETAFKKMVKTLSKTNCEDSSLYSS